MKIEHIKHIMMLCLLVAVLALAGCGAEIKEKQVNTPIKVGVVLPLTGQVADLGLSAKAAIEMAVEEIHAEGGVNGRPIQLIFEDGMCDPKTASNAGNKLINADKVKYIIGGFCSAETSAFVPVSNEQHVLQISPTSSAPALSQAGPWFFRVYPSDAYQGVFGAEYAYNKMGARKAGVIYVLDDWGTGIKDTFVKRFKELGGEVVAVEGINKDDNDARTQLTKLKSAGADFIYMPTFAGNAAAVLKQRKELGWNVKVLGGDGAIDETVVKIAGDASEGFMASGVDTNPSAEVKQKFKQRTGYDFKLGSDHGYDALKILVHVMKKVGADDNDKVRRELEKTTYNGITGTIKFDENGDVVGAKYKLRVVKNGKFEMMDE